jgi:RHS repeat-associated protein
MTLGNGVVTTYTNDAASQMRQLKHQLGATIINSLDYTYDKVSNRKTKINRDGTHNYTYDTLNRLVEAINPLPANPLETYNYDPVGNRTDSNQNGLSQFNVANELNEDGAFTYQYDNNGNLTRKTAKVGGAVTTYEYDAENKLLRVVMPGTTVDYKYDGLGRRVEKNIVGPTTRITHYVYDNEDIILELDGSNNILARYTHGPGIDEPLIMEKGGANFFYHADGLTSITEITNQSGAAVQRYTYSSFGEIESTLDPNFVQPYTFTSREFDPETGLYFHRSRTLNPDTGTFLSQDRVGFLGGINFYSYVMNNPTTFIDPLGFLKFSWGVGGVLGIFDVNWNSANPLETSVNLVTPQLGAGFNFCAERENPSQPLSIDKPTVEQGCAPSKRERSKQLAAEAPLQELPFTYSVGRKYLGFSFTDNFKTWCVNLGFAIGPLPVNVSVPLFSFEAR